MGERKLGMCGTELLLGKDFFVNLFCLFVFVLSHGLEEGGGKGFPKSGGGGGGIELK